MSQHSPKSALLVAIHADILPFYETETTAELAGDVVPTRPTASSEYSLGHEGCQLGRDPLCEVRVAEARIDVSRRHATIKLEGGAYVLYDHSLHGTYVNGQRITGVCRLDSGDIIGLANTREMLHFIDYGQFSQAHITLTEREQQILRLLVTGCRIKEIAETLVISQNTVNSHLKNIYNKLGANSRGEAIRQANKLRLI
jgi:DNA-binding CsgD family transcriptional regulator